MNEPGRIERLADGRTPDGEAVEYFRLGAGGLTLEVMSLGCTLTRLMVPDRTGTAANVVLGHADLAACLRGREYFGAIVGRLANRLREGVLRLPTGQYRLSINHGPHHLHGGVAGFDRRVWHVIDTHIDAAGASVEFERTSPVGEEGYPGTLVARVRYTLTRNGALDMALAATTDATTVVNLTNHSYFNLAGEGNGDVLGHVLTFNADRFVEIDEELLPTGTLPSVVGTPFDFRRATTVGARIGLPHPQLQRAGGYDHCMALPPAAPAGSMQHACTLFEPAGGRQLEIWTDQPGVQLYSGNFLDGSAVNAQGIPYHRHAGLCLETQRFPDAPNHPSFPSVLLQPGQRYFARTRWQFTAR